MLDAWGVEKFKKELEARVGRELAPPKDLTWTRADDYLGWHRQGDGNWFAGVRIISGRVKDFDGARRVRTGLRVIVEKYRLEVRLTPQQNVYLVGIRGQDRATIAALLREHGIAEPEALPPVLRHAISCQALPTCGQAITESERIMPEVVAETQDELNAVGLTEDVVHLRTSGCPDGCSRPYRGELWRLLSPVGIDAFAWDLSPRGSLTQSA